MESQDALSIAFSVADESARLVKVFVFGVRVDGSVLVLNSGLSIEEIKEMSKDMRVWIGEQIGNSMKG